MTRERGGGGEETQAAKPHTCSLKVFRRHIDRVTLPDGSVVLDASRIHSVEAYQDWLESRGAQRLHNPAQGFQRTLTAHLSESLLILLPFETHFKSIVSRI